MGLTLKVLQLKYDELNFQKIGVKYHLMFKAREEQRISYCASHDFMFANIHFICALNSKIMSQRKFFDRFVLAVS
jgi:hypothetical protein